MLKERLIGVRRGKCLYLNSRIVRQLHEFGANVNCCRRVDLQFPPFLSLFFPSSDSTMEKTMLYIFSFIAVLQVGELFNFAVNCARR